MIVFICGSTSSTMLNRNQNLGISDVCHLYCLSFSLPQTILIYFFCYNLPEKTQRISRTYSGRKFSLGLKPVIVAERTLRVVYAASILLTFLRSYKRQ